MIKTASVTRLWWFTASNTCWFCWIRPQFVMSSTALHMIPELSCIGHLSHTEGGPTMAIEIAVGEANSEWYRKKYHMNTTRPEANTQQNHLHNIWNMICLQSSSHNAKWLDMHSSRYVWWTGNQAINASCLYTFSLFLSSWDIFIGTVWQNLRIFLPLSHFAVVTLSIVN